MTVNLPVFSLARKKIRQAIGLEAISACARSKQIKYDDLICWDYFCSNQNNIEVDFWQRQMHEVTVHRLLSLFSIFSFIVMGFDNVKQMVEEISWEAPKKRKKKLSFTSMN